MRGRYCLYVGLLTAVRSVRYGPAMSDFVRTPQMMKREVSAEGGALWRTLYHLWPYMWPADRPDLKARVLTGAGAAAGGEARHHRGAVHLQMGDRRAGAGHRRCAVDHARARGAARDDRGLWRHAHPDGGADPGPRRAVRQGRHECGAPARDPHLRAYAPALAALSSRAQDRRAHPRSRARAQRHRDHRADGDPAARPDHRRSADDLRRAALSVRLALRGGHLRHRRAVHVVHLHRDRVADRHPPQDERERHRRQHQGDRFPAQLRDRQVFQRRAARDRALRPLDGALRAGERPGLCVARGPQCRSGRDLHASASPSRWGCACSVSRPGPTRSAISS